MKNRPNKCAKCNSDAVLLQTFDNICGNTPMYFVKCVNTYCGERTYATDTIEKAVDDWNKGKTI